MKHLRKPTRREKEKLSNYKQGCVSLNPANWLVERRADNKIVCVNRKNQKKKIILAAWNWFKRNADPVYLLNKHNQIDNKMEEPFVLYIEGAIFCYHNHKS